MPLKQLKGIITLYPMTDKANQVPIHHFRRDHSDDKDAIPLEITPLEQLPRSAGEVSPNRHTFYAILWLTGGAGTHYIDFRGYPFQANAFHFIAPGRVHFWDIQAPLTGYAILFSDDFLHLNQFDPKYLHSFDFFHRLDQEPVLYLNDEQAQFFHDLIQSLLTEYYATQFGRIQAIQAYLQLLLIQAQRHYPLNHPLSAPSTDVMLLDQFRQLIDQNFVNKRQVQEYADLLSVTSGHLTRLSKQVMGHPAGAIIRKRVVLEAKRLLAYTDNTIAEVGVKLQFKDPSYFGRFFKRETGQSPLSFRRSLHEKYQEMLG